MTKQEFDQNSDLDPVLLAEALNNGDEEIWQRWQEETNDLTPQEKSFYATISKIIADQLLENRKEITQNLVRLQTTTRPDLSIVLETIEILARLSDEALERAIAGFTKNKEE